MHSLIDVLALHEAISRRTVFHGFGLNSIQAINIEGMFRSQDSQASESSVQKGGAGAI